MSPGSPVATHYEHLSCLEEGERERERERESDDYIAITELQCTKIMYMSDQCMLQCIYTSVLKAPNST